MFQIKLGFERALSQKLGKSNPKCSLGQNVKNAVFFFHVNIFEDLKYQLFHEIPCTNPSFPVLFKYAIMIIKKLFTEQKTIDTVLLDVGNKYFKLEFEQRTSV